LEKFNEKNCKTLAGKPKLFFIQADLETRIGNGKNLVDCSFGRRVVLNQNNALN